jgi:hypothetical protein
MSTSKIRTKYWPMLISSGPIPIRQFDCSAMEDGGNEHMCGWGRTEQEAIDDVERLQAEEADYLEEKQKREAQR